MGVVFTLHFDTINTNSNTCHYITITNLHYTLLLLIPYFKEDDENKSRKFTLHFATINTVIHFTQYL